MKTFLKYLGLLLIVVGAAVLAVPFFMGTTTNLSLSVGLGVIVLGLISFITINKYVD